MAVYLGAARARVDTTLGAEFSICLSTVNAVPTNQGSDRPTYMLNAGESIQLYYNRNLDTSDGTNTVDLWVYYETGTGTLVRTLYSGSQAGLTAGQAFTFWATHDGTETGNPRSGTLRLRARHTRTGTAAGLGNFVIDTDGGSSPPSLGSVGYEDQGKLIARNPVTLSHQSGYPAGDKHSYGPAGDELATVRASYSPPWSVRGHEQAKLDILDGVDVQLAGSTATVSSGGFTDFSAVVNETNFDLTLKTYGARFVVNGLAQLQATSEGGTALWTTFSANAGGQTLFDADPRLTSGTPATNFALSNIGDATEVDWGITNSRGEALTRNLTLVLKDSLGATKKSIADTGSNYDLNYTLLSGDDATADATGKQWTIETLPPGQVTTLSGNVFKVSRYRTISAATPSFALANYGEVIEVTASVTRADGNPWSNNVSATAVDDAGATYDTATETPDGSGQISFTHTPVSPNKAVATPTGTPYHLRIRDTDGNVQLDTADAWSVSSLRLIDLHTQLVGTLNKDDFPSEDANEEYAAVILGNVVYTWAHVENIRNDGTEVQTTGSSLNLLIKDPDGGIQATYNFDTGADGWSSRINVNPGAPAGEWTYELDLIDQHNNVASASHTVTYITPLTSNLAVIGSSAVLIPQGTEHEFRVRCEIDNLLDTPQQLPTWRLFDEDLVEIASGNMRNVIDDQETIDGGVYRVLMSDLGYPAQGRYALQYEAKLSGNGIKNQVVFRIANNKFDPVGFSGGPR